MKRLHYILYFLLCFVFHSKVNGQANLIFQPNKQCGTYTYCVDLELAANSGSFQIGTSTIFLTYNQDALTYSSYTGTAFDGTSTCTSVWMPQTIDVDDTKGKLQITLKHLSSDNTCDVVDGTKKIIGTICFTIQQQGGIPNLKIDATKTFFNSYLPNNGNSPITLNSIDSLVSSDLLVCDCPSVGASCDDNNGFTTNDQYDLNCQCIGQTLDTDADGVADGVDPCYDIIYEAEDAYTPAEHHEINSHQFYGTGFVGMHSWTGDTLEFTINAQVSGNHDFTIRYANGSSNSRYLKYAVDDTVIHNLIYFPSTSSFYQWDTIVLHKYLAAGTHKVLFSSNPGFEPYIDRLTVSFCTGCPTAGQWCDDGNLCTTLDVIDVNCNCAGVLLDSDNDGVCDNSDICSGSDDNIDTDGDRTPDGCDNCNNNLIGTVCSDGDTCTINDVYDANCNCIGTFTGGDADNDGVCDAFDVCSGSNDNLDMDSDGIPDGCDNCDNRTINTPCNDGNPCTVLDVIQSDCSCSGIPIPVDISSSTKDVSCQGLNDGEIDVNVAGAFGDLNYQWSHGAPNTQADLTSLSPGTYKLTVTDFRNCTDSSTFTITEPDKLVINHFTVMSSGNDGSIDLTISGGISPYVFNWHNGETTEDLNTLIPDTYHVTVTDANNCSENQTIDIFPEGTCVDTVIQAEDGQIVGMSIDNWNETWALGDGRIYMTDAAVQTASYDFYISEVGFHAITIRYQAPSNNNKHANISVDGQVQFSNMHFPSTGSQWKSFEFVSSFSVGTHQLEISKGSSNWGLWFDFIAICNINLSADTVATHNDCFGDANGTASVNITGGRGSYQYLWNTGATTSNLSQLAAGAYTVTVTDSIGITMIDTIYISQPDAVGAQANIQNSTGFDGQINITPNGGTAPFTYLWNDNSTSQNRTGLAPGNYHLTITDSKNCTYTQTYNVQNAVSLPVNLISFGVSPLANLKSHLTWSTASEEHFSHFELEHSTDGFYFEKFDKIFSENGNTNTSQYYETIHQNAQIGFNYYRLKMVDTNGSFEYSAIKMVEFTEKGDISIYPNPVRDMLYIQNNYQKVFKIQLYSSIGQLLGEYDLQNGQQSIDVEFLSKGVYTLKILNQNNMAEAIYVHQFVK